MSYRHMRPRGIAGVTGRGSATLRARENARDGVLALLALLLLPVLLWLIVLAASASWAAVIDAFTPDPYVIPAPAGTRTDEPVDLILVIDDSSSMAQSDPDNRRYRSARNLIGYFRDRALPGVDDRVGVVHFGDTAPPELSIAPASLNESDLDSTLSARDLGGTAFLPALASASRFLTQEPGRRQVVVVFTDGQSDEDPTEIARAVASMPTPNVHLVLFGQNAQGNVTNGPWSRAPLNSTTGLQGLNDGELDDTYAAILVCELDMTWQGRPTPTTWTQHTCP